MKGGFVLRSVIVSGGISLMFGRKSSAEMSRSFSYIGSSKSGYAIAGTRCSGSFNHPGENVRPLRDADHDRPGALRIERGDQLPRGDREIQRRRSCRGALMPRRPTRSAARRKFLASMLSAPAPPREVVPIVETQMPGGRAAERWPEATVIPVAPGREGGSVSTR